MALLSRRSGAFDFFPRKLQWKSFSGEFRAKQQSLFEGWRGKSFPPVKCPEPPPQNDRKKSSAIFFSSFPAFSRETQLFPIFFEGGEMKMCFFFFFRLWNVLSQRGREGDLYPNGFPFSPSCMWEKLLRLMRLRAEFFPRRYVPGKHISLSLERGGFACGEGGGGVSCLFRSQACANKNA